MASLGPPRSTRSRRASLGCNRRSQESASARLLREACSFPATVSPAGRPMLPGRPHDPRPRHARAQSTPGSALLSRAAPKQRRTHPGKRNVQAALRPRRSRIRTGRAARVPLRRRMLPQRPRRIPHLRSPTEPAVEQAGRRVHREPFRPPLFGGERQSGNGRCRSQTCDSSSYSRSRSWL